MCLAPIRTSRASRRCRAVNRNQRLPRFPSPTAVVAFPRRFTSSTKLANGFHALPEEEHRAEDEHDI